MTTVIPRVAGLFFACVLAVALVWRWSFRRQHLLCCIGFYLYIYSPSSSPLVCFPVTFPESAHIASTRATKMLLTIKFLSGKTTIIRDLAKDATVGDLKARVVVRATLAPSLSCARALLALRQFWPGLTPMFVCIDFACVSVAPGHRRCPQPRHAAFRLTADGRRHQATFRPRSVR